MSDYNMPDGCRQSDLPGIYDSDDAEDLREHLKDADQRHANYVDEMQSNLVEALRIAAWDGLLPEHAETVAGLFRSVDEFLAARAAWEKGKKK